MPRIALVTHGASPALTADDAVLAEALETLGAAAGAVPWDAQEADWTSYDLVVLRSTWDYHLRVAEFHRWLAELVRRGVPLVNPYAVVHWNGDKRYLMDLAAHDVAIVPTEFVGADDAGGTCEPLEGILRRTGWNGVVVKPTVSASGHETWRTSLDRARHDEARFRALCARAPSGVMVQPFMSQIVTEGEWSFVFIGGRYSHAAIKRARDGEFRVQSEHGGTYAPAVPPAGLMADAERAVAAAAACVGVPRGDLAYARVDGVAADDGGGARLLLMELECIEPSLFFLQAPDAAPRMAEVLMRLALAPVRRTPYLRWDTLPVPRVSSRSTNTVETQQTSRPYSVTCVTHDEAVLHCLNALAYFSEHVGAEPAHGTTVELSGLPWPQRWEREDGRVQFHFSDPRRRSMFLGEATRLLSGKWTRIAVEDEVASA